MGTVEIKNQARPFSEGTPDLRELLERCGHKPGKYGTRWICGNCPPGKSPALKIDRNVFFCHRCGRGGNVQTLRKSLGFQFQRKTLSTEDRRRFSIARERFASFQAWLADERAQLIRGFRQELALEAWIRDQYQELISAGADIPGPLIDLAFDAATEIDRLRTALDELDTVSTRELYAKWIKVRQ